jgi:molybdopterin molybdotransferase
MIELSAALELLFQTVSRAAAGRSSEPALGVERVSLDQAAGRVLAEDVRAVVPVPRHDYSAMDGYAVHSADLAGSDPWSLPVVGECRTGHPTAAFRRGAAVRIFTGAAVPLGADAVVMQENTTADGDAVVVRQAVRPGENIRRAGEDLGAGDLALVRGTRLRGFQLGLLATVDRSEVLVARAPRVGVLCTGDELRPPGSPGAPGLAESNSVGLVALARGLGAQAAVAPLVADEPAATRRALEEAALAYDVVLTVGGVSVGDHDLVRPTLTELGAEMVFAKVAIRPGKPVLLARLGRSWILGLPGNPASALVTFAFLGAPLLRALQGDQEASPERRILRLAAPFRQGSGRLGLYRGRTRGGDVEILSNQASGASTAMAWGNCFVLVPADVRELGAGEAVEVVLHAEL